MCLKCTKLSETSDSQKKKDGGEVHRNRVIMRNSLGGVELLVQE